MLADGMRKLNGGLAVSGEIVGLAAYHGWRRNVRRVRWRPPGGVVQRVGALEGATPPYRLTLGAITGSKAVVLDRG